MDRFYKDGQNFWELILNQVKKDLLILLELNLLINITIQSFKSENELELSLLKWNSVKDKFMPRLDRKGLQRYSITRIWNKKGQFQLGHIFEYKDEQAMKECLPIWKDIEQEFKEKIPNIAVGYRGILLDQYESKG